MILARSVHELSRRLHFVKQLGPKRLDHVVILVGQLDEIVRIHEFPDLLQSLVVAKLEQFFHLRLDMRQCPVMGRDTARDALAPKQCKQNDDWQRDAQQPKQSASTEAHENLHCCWFDNADFRAQFQNHRQIIALEDYGR
jgi:hypothetical protein